MKFKLFSVVVGTSACIAQCPFCVSGEKPCKENSHSPKINVRNLKIAANLANRSDIDTVMLTSRGEPTLFPEQITEYLSILKEFNFPFIELQTNGILLLNEKYKKYLKLWYDLGLTTIAISTVSDKYELNKKNYTPNGSYYNLPNLIKLLHDIGFSVRLTCVCCKDLMDTTQKVESYIQFAKENKVEQVTLRPVNDEYRRQSAMDWIKENKLTDADKISIKEYLDSNGTKLLELERIGTVYDIYGQNVCFSLPLTKYTRDTNPDNARQLIYFPDGHIRYEWEMDGGILL